MEFYLIASNRSCITAWTGNSHGYDPQVIHFNRLYRHMEIEEIDNER